MISLVIPMLNEKDSVEAVYARVSSAAKRWGDDYEVIVIDDGSTDRTPVLLHEICCRDPFWRVVRFSRNFGHQAAVSAGLQYASGEAVAVIDGDLQDPPEILADMLEVWRSGAHVVYGVRRNRKEGVLKRSAYALFYRLLNQISPLDIPLDCGDFCVMDRAVVDVLNSLPEKTRFLRGLRAWSGFRQVPFEYERQARERGVSHYTLSKLVRLASDGLVSFSSAPLRLASWLGIGLCGCSVGLAALLVGWWLSRFTVAGIHPSDAVGWTSVVCLILLLAGLQMLLTGILGEYVARVFDEVKARPAWVVAQTLNVPSVTGGLPKHEATSEGRESQLTPAS